MRIKRSYSRVPAVAVIQFLTECDQLFLSWQGAWQTGPVICAPLPDVGLVGQIGSGDDCFGSPQILGHSNWLVTETVNYCSGGPFSCIREGIPVKPPVVNSHGCVIQPCG